ncbi:cyclic peptide export ABC transporter [Trinickia caryophylli]|uniref:Putative ATP-binding cassette transporter n=1 Tax=Trinickia caryophylli TaxID=28094 RepID=A0A1X7GAP9_TRICW|nr:cyclic peptide export ABC transporter [Trinickia caryophylli]PMS11337.1 cyclic peptide export ABC transporter [Trinickia caryophylli]TRX17526.1 cyclic peptide export ABC transporter [Trinickia caryophylli]WQE11725.1 cyclic peptide export ABC transporter [Trinickia caryophylli]SMF66856.1 putative ATP-binding cassette transporter [Trinickia caryophylli]GLU34913.1 peptide ABC transporter ATP-binding protein [Trinickia caryophylli]
MSLLLHLVRKSRWALAAALAASVAGGLGNAALLALVNQALGASADALARLGWQFLAVGVVVLAMRTLAQSLFMWLGQKAKATLRMRTIRRIGEASYPHLEKQGAAKSLAVLTQDLDTIVVFFVSLPALAMQSAVIVGCLIYLGYLSWPILAVAVVSIVLGMAGFRYAHTRAMFHLRTSRKREDDLVKHFRALFDGAKELKLHRERKRAFIENKLETNVEAVRVQRTRGYMLYAAASSWGNFILFAFIGLTLFVFARYIQVDPHVMSGYAIVFVYMIMPIEAVLSAIPNLSSARVALERIEQVNAELPPEKTLEPATVHAFSTIALEGATHRYFREKENEVFTLGPIDLSFRPGEVVFLIGGNGSGKTTLAKMLVGLYAPESGRVLLDGKPVDEAHRDRYRQQFSVVFSDFFLFDDLLGLPSTGLDALAQQLLVELHLDHKVSVKDGVFSTLALSQGQRKRLALLVAYLEDRPFYVFDEWAADQDPLFKDVFYRRLLPELKAKGKTVLVITHDDRYFSLADRFVKLDFGHIVEEGPGAAIAHAAPASRGAGTPHLGISAS